MDIKDILDTIPHRYPFLLIDRVLEMRENEYIKAIKCVTINEPFFPGHFPGHPIMPGVLIIEAMAQAAAYLATKSTMNIPGKKIPLFAAIDGAKFKRPVVPGDTLVLELKVTKSRQKIWWLEGTATVGEELACKAEITAVMMVQE